MRQGPGFSIVIPARNEAENIVKAIESIKANDMQGSPYEIIVVDHASTDGTALLASGAGAKVMRADTEATVSGLRNMGAGASTGDVLVFIDADMVSPPDVLECADGYFSEGFKGALGFSQAVPREAGWVGRAWADRSGYGRLREKKDMDYLPGGNIFINRSVFEEIGGFTETLRTGEDKDLTFKVKAAGHRVLYSPERSFVHMGFERGLAEFIRKEFWRQGSTLALAARWGYSMRTLRNPLLSLWHLAALLAVPALLFLPSPRLALAVLVAWAAPSVLIALRGDGLANPIETMCVFALTFIRWNAAAVALVYQLALMPFEGRAPL